MTTRETKATASDASEIQRDTTADFPASQTYSRNASFCSCKTVACSRSVDSSSSMCSRSSKGSSLTTSGMFCSGMSKLSKAEKCTSGTSNFGTVRGLNDFRMFVKSGKLSTFHYFQMAVFISSIISLIFAIFCFLFGTNDQTLISLCISLFLIVISIGSYATA